MKRTYLSAVTMSVALCLLSFATTAMAKTDEEKLGKLLYFDTHLSLNQNQSCASCHHQNAGFADPLNAQDPWNNVVSLGSDPSLNGGRNAPTSSYAAFIPVFHLAADGLYYGGQFWDGRANTLKDQAKGPFLNPVEMAMADEAAVIAAIADPSNSNYKSYQKLFFSVYGIDLTDPASYTVTDAYDKMAQAIAAFEQTSRFTEFTSKYDYYLAGLATLTTQEADGLALFEGKAQCALCHPSAAVFNLDGTIEPPLFTDFSYDNLGIPKSVNPLIAGLEIDLGLAAGNNILIPLDDLEQKGKFRVSGLRNIALTPPYGHNGYFATLAEIVNFYNTAGDGSWPAPEVAENVNRDELGTLELTPQEEADLVSFLMTLSDGYGKAMPVNFVLPPITPLN